LANSKQIDLPKLNANFTTTFYTVSGSYPVVARSTSGSVPSNSRKYFDDGLISFNTNNDLSNNNPSFSIMLTDAYDWKSLLVPNDYVRIDVSYYSNIFSDEAGKVVKTTLITGLITSVELEEDAGNNSRFYVITCKGVAKIMDNITLTAFTELTSNLSSGLAMIQEDSKTGIMFNQRSSGNIIGQVLNRFIFGDSAKLTYNFQGTTANYKMEDILKVKIEENTDEALSTNYSQYQNYNGSILSMVKDLSSAPFNEFYWTHEDGVATLNYRPTPFDPERWRALPSIQIDPSNIIQQNVSVNDSEQFSTFKLLANGGILSVAPSGGFGNGFYIVTNESLIRRYGYKDLEVPTDYFGTNTNKDDNASDVSANVSTWAKRFTSQAKKAASYYNQSVFKKVNPKGSWSKNRKTSENGEPDWTPYILAIIDTEHKLNSSSQSDPANSRSRGSASSTAQGSCNYVASFLSDAYTKGKKLSPAITSNLVFVQSYNMGLGYEDYLNSISQASNSTDATFEYSKRLAKARGNTGLSKTRYNTAQSKANGKEWIYSKGGNPYYYLEVSSRLSGSFDTSISVNATSAPSSQGKTESAARKKYPYYANIADAFAYASDSTVNNQYTVPAELGGITGFESMKSYLKKSPTRKNFYAWCAKRSPVISESVANKIYTEVKNSKNDLTRSEYIQYQNPNAMLTSSNLSKSSKYLKSYKTIKAHPLKASEELITEMNYNIGSKQAYEIVQSYIKNKGITHAEYQRIMSRYKYNDKQDGVNSNGSSVSSSVSYLTKVYTEKLFNWYADNSKFSSGTIVMNGTSGIESGKRLIVKDTEREGVYWEYYIESVSHNFSYSTNWITTVGVTRGLPLSGLDDNRRFTTPKSFWGTSQPFIGGYFGELTVAQAEEKYKSSSGGGDDESDADDSGDGSALANKAASIGKDLVSKRGKGSIYDQGAHGDTSALEKSPARGDCSQFVYYCYKEAGLDISHGGSWTTWDIAKSSNLKTVSSNGSNKSSAKKKMKNGDIIFFNTEGTDSHMGIYIGDGKFVGFQSEPNMLSQASLSNSYWQGAFGGHVMRSKK